MKEIKAYIRTAKLNDVIQAVKLRSVTMVTATKTC